MDIPIISDVLNAILCAILALAAKIIDLFALAINGLFSLIGATIGLVLAILPGMPDTPQLPEGKVLDSINWLLPIEPLLGFLGVALITLASGFLLMIVLRWLKMVSS